MSSEDQSAGASGPIGRTLGQFKIVGLLGEGGMGVVYRAIDNRLRRTVALKVLPAEAMRDEARRRRFFREARSAAAVSHANVAAIYEIGEEGGEVFIAMELVEGTTLRARMDAGRLPLSESLRIAKAIARALGKAHEKGIVHRDLKPENVMLDEDREVKVLDFGLAKLLDGAPETKSILEMEETASTEALGRIAGTPAYMSPEQATGKATDARSDVFSFGVILFEMLAGARPFHGTTTIETLVAIARDEAPPVSGKVALPPAVEAVVERCLKKSADQRFPSGRELAAALDAIESSRSSLEEVGNLPTVNVGFMPSIDTVTKDPRRLARERPPIARALALTGAVLVAGGIAIALLRTGSKPLAAVPSAKAVASAAASSTALAPEGVKPEAVALFATSEREKREGRRDLACADVTRASDLDPTFARAGLTAAICRRGSPIAGRTYFQRAWVARATLPESTRSLVDAFEPIYQRDPEDRHENLVRLEVAAARFPTDPEIRTAYALELWDRDIDGLVRESEASLRLNPVQPRLLEVMADNLAYRGRFDDARSAIDRCLATSPAALGCMEESVWIDGAAGKCAAVETMARRMLAVDAKHAEGAQFLANALLAEGSSVGALREVLRRKHDALPDAQRRATERDDTIAIDLVTGDFAEAAKLEGEIAQEARTSTSQSDHGRPARLLVMIDEESGRDDEASKIAAAYLDGRDGWDPEPRFDDWALANEPTPLMLAARVRAHAMTSEARDAEVARTIARWKARADSSITSFLWIYGYAAPAESPAEGEVALTALASFPPLPPYTPLSLTRGDVGRAFLLGGRTDDAIASLEQATSDCFALDFPIEHTRARFELGLAREAKGDAAGACAAYRAVRDRWGNAKPRSVTARKAAARIAALHCAQDGPQ